MLNFCDFIQVYVFTTNHHLNLALLFLSRLRPPKLLASTLCTYFHQMITAILIPAKEKRKYVAGQGIEAGTSVTSTCICS